jgi:hypothetical protein
VSGPTWDQAGVAINAQLFQNGEWCGFPMPLPGLRLTVEDRNPWKASVAELQAIVNADDPDSRSSPLVDDGGREGMVVNEWWSRRLRCRVAIARDAEGYFPVCLDFERGRRVRLLLDSMAATRAQSPEAEFTAQMRLGDLIKPHLFQHYLLSGVFLETSRRSGVTYIFRRGRPTLAIRSNHVLAALCLHPVGYYSDTWTGSMVPTDEVIAHLLMMRGDEPMFWRRANQHDPDHAEAGL